MKNTVILTAVAGIASAAAAQSGSLSIVSSASTIDTSTAGASFTLSVYADADFGTHIAGGGFTLGLTGDASGAVTDMVGSATTWGQGFAQDNGFNAGQYDGLVFGQLIFPPVFNPAAESALADGSVLVGSVVVSVAAGQYGEVNFTSGQVTGNFTLSIFDEVAGSPTELFEADVNFGSASVNLVPTPASMALLGLGGLVAGRRRR